MNETLLEGLSLLGLGMGFVLSFLCVMIASMFVMSKCVRYLNTIFPEAVEVTAKKSAVKSVGDDALIALAIVASKFRK